MFITISVPKLIFRCYKTNYFTCFCFLTQRKGIFQYFCALFLINIQIYCLTKCLKFLNVD